MCFIHLLRVQGQTQRILPSKDKCKRNFCLFTEKFHKGGFMCILGFINSLFSLKTKFSQSKTQRYLVHHLIRQTSCKSTQQLNEIRIENFLSLSSDFWSFSLAIYWSIQYNSTALVDNPSLCGVHPKMTWKEMSWAEIKAETVHWSELRSNFSTKLGITWNFFRTNDWKKTQVIIKQTDPLSK